MRLGAAPVIRLERPLAHVKTPGSSCRSAGQLTSDRRRYLLTPTSIGRPRFCMGTRREVAVKPSYGTGHLGTWSNASALCQHGSTPARNRCPKRLPGTPEPSPGWSATVSGSDGQDSRQESTRANVSGGEIGRIRPPRYPKDIRAAAPRRGATSYGPLLRVHGETATRRVRVSQKYGSPKAAKRPPRALGVAPRFGLWGLDNDDAG
jgi:hypothetical protein